MHKTSELKAIFATSFKDYDSITIRELYEALDSHGIPREPIYAGSPAYAALYELGYGKSGEFFYRRTAAPSKKPVPASSIVVSSSSSTERVLPVARTDFADGEPRVRDAEPRLRSWGSRGLGRSRDLIDGIPWRLGFAHRGANLGAAGGRPSEEQWLTEHQATYIVAKCETPIANNILQKVVAVFVAARRRTLGVGAFKDDPVIQMRRQQIDHEKRLTRLEALAQAANLSEPKTASVAASVVTPIEKAFPEYLAVWEFAPAMPWRQRGAFSLIVAKISRKLGVPIGVRASSKWGKINTYSKEVLELAQSEIKAA